MKLVRYFPLHITTCCTCLVLIIYSVGRTSARIHSHIGRCICVLGQDCGYAWVQLVGSTEFRSRTLLFYSHASGTGSGNSHINSMSRAFLVSRFIPHRMGSWLKAIQTTVCTSLLRPQIIAWRWAGLFSFSRSSSPFGLHADTRA